MIPEVRLVANCPFFSFVEFAEVLERLETQFYQEALAKFVEQDFKDAGIAVPQIAVENFQAILEHETAHTLLYVPSVSSPFQLIYNSHVQLRYSSRRSWCRASSKLHILL